MNILVFSGTSDGNELVRKLAELEHDVTVSVATDYAIDFIASDSVTILSGRLDTVQIVEVILKNKVDFIIDATHPYATQVSENITTAFTQASENCTKIIRKLRLLREQSHYDSHVVLVDDIKTACELTVDGNVLATTGSKQMGEYIVLADYKKRLYTRVLPTKESVELCKQINLDDTHIIQSLGALSVEENIATIKQYDIKNMITKDGGEKGGFPQKSEACSRAGVKLFVVKRPSEVGFSLEEILAELLKGELGELND